LKRSRKIKIILLEQQFEVFLPRVDLITLSEIYNFETLEKILTQKHVFITDDADIAIIIDYYQKFNLFKSGYDQGLYFDGFPIRKLMDRNLKNKLIHA
jgi:hypothetical protein